METIHGWVFELKRYNQVAAHWNSPEKISVKLDTPWR